jgi:hypothetical protein
VYARIYYYAKACVRAISMCMVAYTITVYSSIFYTHMHMYQYAYDRGQKHVHACMYIYIHIHTRSAYTCIDSLFLSRHSFRAYRAVCSVGHIYI